IIHAIDENGDPKSIIYFGDCNKTELIGLSTYNLKYAYFMDENIINLDPDTEEDDIDDEDF
ncbi:MAG: hypothetical protein ACOC2U_02765, partial [bacterium]